ncbi:MAG: YbjQ family protein [Blastocatellia bacterium]
MKSNKRMIVTTTSTLDGWKIEAYLGTVSTHIVAGTGFFSDLFASFSDVFGGRSESYQKQLASIHDDAIEKLKQKAISMGANAIVGFRIDHDEISGKDKQMFMVTAIGTAVRASKSEEEQEEERKEYQVIGQDDFSSLVRKRQIVRLAREGGLMLDENTWSFLKENQVHEVAANISATVGKFYEKEFLDESDRAFIKHSREYYSSLSDDIATKYLYKMLT